MLNISTKQALTLAEEHFPNAPEKIAELYGIEVRHSPLNCDGWCLQLDDRAIIRINSTTSAVRRRFTLAHELAHLILGIPAVVGESVFNTANRKNAEERKVDKLASHLLLPKAVILSQVTEVPLTAAVIKKLARMAKISDLAVALRVAATAPDLGVNKASVVFYENDEMVWQWSETLELSKEGSQKLLLECTKAAPAAARIPHEQNQVVVASFVANPSRKTKTVFLQLVAEAEGLKKLHEERIRELDEYVFQGNTTFKQSLNGRFGVFKRTSETLSLDDAMQLFISNLRRYPNMLEAANVERLLSEKGREYIRLRLQVWTKK